MTDMDTAAGEGLRRRRGGGREGHARNAAPQQPPWAQPRMRYGPTQVLSAGQDAQEPHVAVDPNGNAFSVWQERTNGKIHAAVGP